MIFEIYPLGIYMYDFTKDLFSGNKYSRWYLELMQTAQSRKKPKGYTEKHHIIPDCMFSDNRAANQKGFIDKPANAKCNMVFLTNIKNTPAFRAYVSEKSYTPLDHHPTR